MIIYLATPIRPKNGQTLESNVAKAKQIALELWKEGYTVFCPAANSDLPISLADKEVEANRWLDGDIEILQRCDAIVIAPGWEYSDGVRNELIYARVHEIPVFFYPDIPERKN